MLLLIDEKLKWQCKEGHIREATPHHIKIEDNDSKCRMIHAANLKRKTIEEI